MEPIKKPVPKIQLLKKPFEYNEKLSLGDPPQPNEDIKNTFCGT